MNSQRLAALAALMIAGGPTMAADYYLSPAGNNANPGTRQAPWQTLAKANATLEPGDTVILLDGEYPGVIEPANSGRQGAPIAYRAENGLAAVLTGERASCDQRVCIYLGQREHIAIDGFRLLPPAGNWMRLKGAKHCVIRNCTMENAKGVSSPIYCKDCHYNRYENLRCWRSNNLGQWGHVAGDMWNNFGCSHNVFEGIHISRAGHRPFGLWFDSPYNVVRRCVFDCRWGRNFEFLSTPRLLVEECVITNGFDGSGSADGRAKLFILDSIFRRNVVYRNYYGPMVINAYKYEDLPTFGMSRSRLYHNTWYRNHEYGYEMVDLGEKPDPHMVNGNVFQNNVFAHNDPGGDGLALLLYSNIAEDNVFKHNLLFGAKPGDKTVRYDWAFPGVSRWDGLTMTAAEANEKKPAQFVGNVDAEPAFVAPERDDFRLREGSPCLDAGKPLAVARESGSGRELPVDDARCFYDGFEIPGEQGDLLFVGPRKQQARLLKADIEKNVLILDRDASWEKGEGLSLPYVGNAPDLGAYERGAEAEPWYSAPTIPDGLRVETMEMETATEPVVVTDFEAENLEAWHYYWNFSRQKNTDARMDDTTAASGKRSMRVFATDDGAILSCDIRPRWWDLDRFPTAKFAYRVPKGVPVGVWLHAFRSTNHGRGAVCVGGTSAREPGSAPDLSKCQLADDDRWHEVTLDARAIREVFPDVKLLQMFRFYTNGNGKKGQQYWFDNFQILPGE
jgi:hypothetical protein